MRILISGMAGFIGAHAARRALDDGHEPVGIDNFWTGSRDNLAWLTADVEFHEHDVREPWPRIAADAILHLACPASPPHYQRDPIFTWETCVLGTREALHTAARLGVPLVIASTSEVYGDPDVSPQPESYWGRVNPIGIRSCYDEGKRAAETLATDMRRLRGVDVRIARIFNTYGPRMAFDDGRVVSNFLVQALRGEPLTIYGNGEQTRSFCYVDDLVDGLYRLLQRGGNPEGPVNLGNPDERTIRELTSVVAEVLGREVRTESRPLPADDPLQRCPDITRAETLLGWAPTVPLAEGIRRTAAAFSARLEAGAR